MCAFMKDCSSSNNIREKSRLLIMQLYQSQPSRLFAEQEVLKKCLQEDQTLDRSALTDAFRELVAEEYLVTSSLRRYKLNKKNIVQGTLTQTHKGKLVFSPDGNPGDLYHVHASFVGNSVPGDYVRVVYMPERYFSPKQVQVLQMIRRSDEEHLGLLHLTEKGRFVTLFIMTMKMDVFIDPTDPVLAEEGQMVYVKIVSWAQKDKCPRGVLTGVVPVSEGRYERNAMRIAAKYGLRTRFKKEVILEADTCSCDIPPSEVEKRLDFRSVPTFTIDPERAKDFDDALSIRRNEDGLWQVGIHIADVSHYVKEGSLLDREASQRTRSAYFNRCVIPMLPEHISNRVCSLLPNEDRLCFSLLLCLNEEVEVVDYKLCKTIIRSQKRYTYEECDLLLSGEAEDEFGEDLKRLYEFAKVFKERRIEAGCLDYQLEETFFHLDSDGVPERLSHNSSTESHVLVEEFMLIANRLVAEYACRNGGERGYPFVYRVEDAPTDVAKRDLTRKLHNLSILVNPDDPYRLDGTHVDECSKSMRNYVCKLVTQSLPRAYYTTRELSHFGLAFDLYCHFTSPIRRYSDLVVHRILSSMIEGTESIQQEELEKIALDCSMQENAVSVAEKEEYTLLAHEYLGTRIGKTFRCIVTGLQQDCICLEIGALHKAAIIKRNTLRKHGFVYNEKRNAFERFKKPRQVLKEGTEVRLDVMLIDAATDRVCMTFKEKEKPVTGKKKM